MQKQRCVGSLKRQLNVLDRSVAVDGKGAWREIRCLCKFDMLFCAGTSGLEAVQTFNARVGLE